MSADAVARFGQNDNAPKVEHQSASKEGFTLDWCMKKDVGPTKADFVCFIWTQQRRSHSENFGGERW